MGPARRLPPNFPIEVLDDFAPSGVVPGERIGSQPPLARAKVLLRRGFMLAVLGAAGWAALTHQATVRAWSSAAFAAASPIIAAATSLMTTAPASQRADLKPAAPAVPVASAMTMAALPERAVPAAKPIAYEAPPPVPAAAPARPAAAEPARAATAAFAPDRPGAEAPTGPLPPVTVDPSDPYQVRAESVGLHPGLSRVLLARLSADDYRNAGIAVRTAIAETPDDAVFVWPRQRKPELALFRVKFVPGAAPDCRRYVVTITKDRWSTTALPMERCGARPGSLRRVSHQQRS